MDEDLLNYEFDQLQLDLFRKIQRSDRRMFLFQSFKERYRTHIAVTICILAFCCGYWFGLLLK